MARLDVGEIAQTKIAIEWRIPDFFSLPENIDESIGSHSFFFLGGNWYIELCPSGETANQSEGYVGIYLMRKDVAGSPRKVTFTFFLKSADGKLKEPKEDTYTLPENSKVGFGWPKFLQRSELVRKKEELAPSGCLTIICSLRMFSEPTASEKTLTSSECGIEKLSYAMIQLLSNGQDSDMNVQVKEKKFRLHRGIMGTRVPAFGAMFQHEMREKATGSVSIDDCEVDVFQDFVYYVYSGRVDKLRTETAFGLFVLADKYQVDELKSACFEFIKHTLSVDTFCDVVNLALTYDEGEMLQQATDFLANNMVEIMETVKWMNFMTESPNQANEILLKAIRKKTNI